MSSGKVYTVSNIGFSRVDINLFYIYLIGFGGGSPACVFVCHICAWYLLRSKEGVRNPRAVVTGNCEPPAQCGCEELN